VHYKLIIKTITFRLTIAVAFTFTAAVLLLFGFIYWQTTIYETRRISELVQSAADRLAQLRPEELLRELEARQMSGPNRQTQVTLFGRDGAVISGLLQRFPTDLPPDGRIHYLARLSLEGHGKSAIAVAVAVPEGRTLVVARSTDVLVELRQVVLHTLVVGVVPLVFLGLAAGTALSIRTIRRLRVMHEAIARIMRGNLSERLPVGHAWDDLDRLTHDMNRMLDEIERLVGETKSVGDNIAHDLRTPLTRMRMRFEHSLRSARTREDVNALIDVSIADLDLTFGIVTALLRIGEIESGRRRAAFGDIDIAAIAKEVADIYAPIAEARGLSLHLRIETAAEAIGDHDLLVEALANLVDNSIKFTPPGGQITIGVSRNDAGPVLRVTDTGPGIPPAERELVLRRFYRGGKSRQVPGHGLGLNLVAAIARLHNFQLVIEDGPGCTLALLCTGTRSTGAETQTAVSSA
jgi:signal transduction histidine kinase